MPFEHRIIQDDQDDSLLQCENVEALLGLDILADQLREDASYLASCYPAEGRGESDVDFQSIGLACESGGESSGIDQQQQRCLNRVSELLETRRQSTHAGWLGRLAGGAAVAVVGVICATVAWRVQVPQERGGIVRDLSSDNAPSLNAQHDQPMRVDDFNRDQFRPVLSLNEPYLVSIPAIGNPLSPTPVVFEMPAVFRSASEPEMEALLDLYDSETAGPVAIGF